MVVMYLETVKQVEPTFPSSVSSPRQVCFQHFLGPRKIENSGVNMKSIHTLEVILVGKIPLFLVDSI